MLTTQLLPSILMSILILFLIACKCYTFECFMCSALEHDLRGIKALYKNTRLI